MIFVRKIKCNYSRGKTGVLCSVCSPNDMVEELSPSDQLQHNENPRFTHKHLPQGNNGRMTNELHDADFFLDLVAHVELRDLGLVEDLLEREGGREKGREGRMEEERVRWR